MLLIQRVKSSVRARAGVVVFRHDLAPLGGATQIGAALRVLVAEGMLIRLGEGIYAKATRDEHGKPVPAAQPQAVIGEVLRKLNVEPADVCTEDEGTRKRVIVDAPNRRIDRQLELGNCVVEIVSHTVMTKHFLPKDPSCFPRRNVGKYIQVLARTHHISSTRTGLDSWTEAVSRAAGDTVQLDAVGRLLAKLRQRHVISGKQMAHLMNNYMTERESAQSGV